MIPSRHGFLGQVPLVLGPGSWGAGMVPMGPVYDAEPGAWGYPRPVLAPVEVPPYFGEWGVVDEATGKSIAGGRVGPFPTIQEAFDAAGAAASDAGARRMPLDGFAQVKDSRGVPVGPII